jgi:hypothetical protein
VSARDPSTLQMYSDMDELEKISRAQELQREQTSTDQPQQNDLLCRKTMTKERPQQVSPDQPHQNACQIDFKRRKDCPWLYTQTSMDWDESVRLCCAIYDPSEDFGYLPEKSFKRIWNNKKYKAAKDFSVRGEVRDTITVCMRCPAANA